MQRPHQRLDGLQLSPRLCIPAQACTLLAVISVTCRNELSCSKIGGPVYGRRFVMFPLRG
jgi:hypothetical protein